MKKLLITLLFAITVFIPFNSLYAHDFTSFTMPFEEDPVSSSVTSFTTGNLSYGEDLEGLYIDIYDDNRHILDDGTHRSRLEIKDSSQTIISTYYFDDYADYTSLETKGFDQTIFIPFEPLGGEPLPEDGLFMEFIIYHDITDIEQQFMDAYLDQMEYDLSTNSQGIAVRGSEDPTTESIYFGADDGYLGRLDTDLNIEWYTQYSAILEDPFTDNDNGIATHIEPLPGTTDIIVATDKGKLLRIAEDGGIVWDTHVSTITIDIDDHVYVYLSAPSVADISINNFGEIYIAFNHSSQPNFIARVNAHGTGLDRYEYASDIPIKSLAATDTRVLSVLEWYHGIDIFSRTLSVDSNLFWSYSTIDITAYDNEVYYMTYDGDPDNPSSNTLNIGKLDSDFNVTDEYTLTYDALWADSYPISGNINIGGNLSYYDALWYDGTITRTTTNATDMDLLFDDSYDADTYFAYPSTSDNSGRYYSRDISSTEIYRHTFTFEKDTTSYDFINEPITALGFQYSGEAVDPDLPTPVAPPDAFNDLLSTLGLNDMAGRVVMYTALAMLILFVVIGANLGRVVGLVGMLGLTGLFMAANLIPLWVSVVMFVIITFGFITLKGVMQNE